MHVHVINDPELSAEQFHVQEEMFWKAVAEVPALRDKIELTIGVGEAGNEALRSADAVVGWSFPRDIAERAPQLRWIHVIGAGVEHLQPLDWVPSGVTLTNSSGVHAERAGEFIACSLLMLNNLFPTHIENQAQKRWDSRYSNVITGKTVLIVGVGSIGGEGARRAKDLGLHVRGVRRSGQSHPSVDEMYTPDRLHEALQGVNFVVVTAASTAETRKLLGARELDLLPAGAGVVNMARSAILDEDALVERLRSGRLGGAILDVFDPEPLPADSPLWTCPRLLITPHVSSDALEYTRPMLEIFLDNAERLEAGRELRNRVELDRGY